MQSLKTRIEKLEASRPPINEDLLKGLTPEQMMAALWEQLERAKYAEFDAHTDEYQELVLTLENYMLGHALCDETYKPRKHDELEDWARQMLAALKPESHDINSRGNINV